MEETKHGRKNNRKRKEKRIEQEEKEILLIHHPYTVVDPWTVMIHF